jgi:3-hydroxyisobutyrate dehydrogenase
MTAEKLGFVGIGLMGEAMTRNLLERGYAVTVWNLEPERLDNVVPHGARPAASPAAVAEASDIVMTCVLHTAAVDNVVFGPDGIASAGTPEKLLIDLSTADPAATRDMAARLKRETGMGWIDAPVSGGPPAARDGTMTVMAGGAPADIARIRPLMAEMAGNFTHMGPSGAGQTTKMINQAIVGTGYVLMAEALILAERAGLDAARLRPRRLESPQEAVSADAGARFRAAAQLCPPAAQGHEGGQGLCAWFRPRPCRRREGRRAIRGLRG